MLSVPYISLYPSPPETMGRLMVVFSASAGLKKMTDKTSFTSITYNCAAFYFVISPDASNHDFSLLLQFLLIQIFCTF